MEKIIIAIFFTINGMYIATFGTDNYSQNIGKYMAFISMVVLIVLFFIN